MNEPQVALTVQVGHGAETATLAVVRKGHKYRAESYSGGLGLLQWAEDYDELIRKLIDMKARLEMYP